LSNLGINLLNVYMFKGVALKDTLSLAGHFEQLAFTINLK